ncbi:TIGR03364 family FAD-dependent oxidoreductase [Nocardioides lianchengensis]|uniref:FAD dependent oxidoreductase TIGR03364 n=1 Tax=Nocardioides lianchengensis TaxID=1045774 RepID=A0A1G7C608_9ACTN|nr:TIGR03364 family FAD-dependent oxidoreductase [Nocardioides lianchengensis]NYG09262.1 FAD dependent oxidoreductase TIGR03364 [Nocardioides lianchengensis]SDE34804.1 FAD dependent oxidoreductase TIGR03364 [Nocardioides lianchengensis]
MQTSASSPGRYDLAVVGAGIVGLAHAADAASRGLRVVVLERDQHAAGASVRNFGHVCTTAQTGEALRLALAARESWLTLGPKAGFDVATCGTVVLARAADEAAVLEELHAARGSEQVRLLTPQGLRSEVPFATDEIVAGALLPLDLRLDPRAALPALAAWLTDEGVEIRWGTHVGSVEPGVVHTSRGPVAADRIVHAVGHDVDRLFPELAAEWDVQRCVLQMLEVAPPHGVVVDPAVLTGLSMLRYGGMAELPSAARLAERLAREQPELLDVAMNLMLTQRPDGSIVLGDTHHYAVTHPPFEDEKVVALVLREGERLLGAPLTVRRRWRGVYANSALTDFLVAEPHEGTRVVAVTSGIGMTTALGLAPTVLDQLL